MTDGCTIVLDLGKTHAKATLLDANGGQLAKRSRANEPAEALEYRALDVAGIDHFVLNSLRQFAAQGQVRRIVTVAHGAAAALLRNGELYAAPMDYEDVVGEAEREDYRQQRDRFATTGSPFLPSGLNLGIQLHRLEALRGRLPDDVTIVPWAQYWAWRLSGVLASETSSLGCHTDLWRPIERRYSQLATERGWAARMAPLKMAGDVLAAITPEIGAATGLPANCQVLCGVHDSNAALLAARGHDEIREHDATVLSTGTWFVAMRSLGAGVDLDANALDESRDCLINVDVSGNPVPSARFMGGREAELICGDALFTHGYDSQAQLDRLPALVGSGACVLPAFVKGVGPFPDQAGSWLSPPANLADKRAITALYLALMADATLELLGSRDRLLVEGRFAEDVIFVRALATLRPQQHVYTSDTQNDVAYGALRLLLPALAPPSELKRAPPLDFDLSAYAKRWKEQSQKQATL